MLTVDKTRLTIFDDGIVINKELPKWKNSKGRLHIKKEAEAKKKAEEGGDKGTIYFTQSQPMSINSTSSSMTTNPFNDFNSQVSLSDYEREEFDKANFNDAAMLGIKDLTDFINETGTDIIYGRSFISNQRDAISGSEPAVKPNFIQKLLKHVVKDKEEGYSIDVVSFFENMKTIGKGSVDTYKDRVEKYLSALRTATITGQISLKENLAREMFVNKYEAELYANGFYYVIDEDTVV